MSTTRSSARRGALLLVVAGFLSIFSIMLAGGASAQNESCPAGGAGGNGARAGTSTGGTGGLGLNVPVFSSGTGGAQAGGANGGSAAGGTGGRGGQGTLPVCNQNTNGAIPAASAPAAGRVVTAGGGGGGAAYGRGGGLAHTGSHTSLELGLAGLALLLGGSMLFVAQPWSKTTK